MTFMSILVVSDNERISKELVELLDEQPPVEGRTVRFGCHPANGSLLGTSVGRYRFEPVELKTEYRDVIQKYDLIISAHCKQLFPSALVQQRVCINVHPGHNPHNRGWYPQVFSILNGLPLGATIHVMDEQLDHGPIIDREMIDVRPFDTSLTAYDRVLDLEVRLLRRNLPAILAGNYATREPEGEGNVNLKRDFNELREIPLDEVVTFGEAIRRLRALSHPPFHNAFFVDPETGERVWVNLDLSADTPR